MKIKGKITISNINSNIPRDSWIRLSLVDENSHIYFVEVDIEFKQFGMALTGSGLQSCDIELRGLESLGKKHENKIEFIRIPRIAGEEDMDGVFAEYEIDGWMASRTDLSNHHNYVADKSDTEEWCCRVSFHRYV